MRDLALWLAVLAAAWGAVWGTRSLLDARCEGYLLCLSRWLHNRAHNATRLAEGFDMFACRWYAMTDQQPKPECQWARREQS